MNKVLVVLGPTATGKTDLAIYLAKKFDGELVACDSRQVYTGLDIGTGKLPGGGRWEVRREKGRWEVGGVNIWMYDVVSPKVQYTVADYVKKAEKIIEDITRRGKLPIIVGGTGLYLKALLEGLPNLVIPVDKNLRNQLNKLTLIQLQEKLKILSISRWEKLNESDKQNPRRLIRAIELGTSPPNKRSFKKDKKFNVLKIGLSAPREVLYKGVDLRVLARLDQGMINEARVLKEKGVTVKRMRKLGLEYGVLANYLEDKITETKLIVTLQNQIHGYVRRQLTWFKKEKDINWFDITDKNYSIVIEKLVRKWYDK